VRLGYTVVPVETRRAFVIARGGGDERRRVVWVRLTDADGAEGWGEAAPNRFYGETADTAAAALEALRPTVERLDPWALEDAEAEMRRALRGNASVRSAVSAALHDLAAKRLGVPLYRLWGLTPERAPRSSFTIGIAADDAELRRRVAEAAEYPILKVKLGTPDRDLEIARTVREAAPDKVLRVDANAAWTPKQAVRMAEALAGLGVEFVEQPVAAHDVSGLRFVRETSRAWWRPTSRGWPARWTASTSSWPSAAGCARRWRSSPPRGRTTCASWPAA
jgi:L-alanine-DL-glutamate epimerase-like enolase superfamily enzyme